MFEHVPAQPRTREGLLKELREIWTKNLDNYEDQAMFFENLQDFEKKLEKKYLGMESRWYQVRNLISGSTGVSESEAPHFDLPEGEFEKYIRNGFTDEGIDFTPQDYLNTDTENEKS